MSILDNGSYSIKTSYKLGDDDFIFVLNDDKKVQVNAPHLRDLKLSDCTKIVIDNTHKKTPIIIHTACSYISACNYIVVS